MYVFLFSPYVPHALSISSSLIWWCECLASSTNHKQFSSLSLLPHSYDYVYPSAPYSQTPSTYVLHSLQYEILDKIAVLYILTFIILDNKRNDKNSELTWSWGTNSMVQIAPSEPNSHSVNHKKFPSSHLQSFPLRFSKQYFLRISRTPHVCNISYPVYLPWFHHSNSILWTA